MYDLTKISSYSLNKMIMGESIKRILSAALEVVDPYRSVQTNLEKIFINKTDADGGKRRIIIISFGKAAEPMASAAIDFFKNRNIQGIVVTKHPDALRIGNLEVIKAGHPTPTQQSVRAAEKIVRILSRSNENDITILLISGGGSSLITKPPVPIRLLDIQKLTTLLLKSGASINDVNCIRRHIDRVKGGGLLQHCLSKEIYSFILSDVISNRLEDIASGPTCVDPTTFSDAWRIIQNFQISESIPKSIKEYLLKGINNQIPETIKSINTKEQIVNNVIIGCNRDAAQAAMSQAKQEGFQSTIITTNLNGEASRGGLWLAKKIITLNRSSNIINQPICCIAGGETTVTVKGDGLGGRNLEVALGAVQKLSGQKSIALLTFATDGEDGKTDSAGAIVTGETNTRAMTLGLDAEKYLANNDSYSYFKRLNDLIIVGPTHTNVNDLNLLFVGLH